MQREKLSRRSRVSKENLSETNLVVSAMLQNCSTGAERTLCCVRDTCDITVTQKSYDLSARQPLVFTVHLCLFDLTFLFLEKDNTQKRRSPTLQLCSNEEFRVLWWNKRRFLCGGVSIDTHTRNRGTPRWVVPFEEKKKPLPKQWMPGRHNHCPFV